MDENRDGVRTCRDDSGDDDCPVCRGWELSNKRQEDEIRRLQAVVDESVRLYDVLDLLQREGYLRSTEVTPFIKPGHGPCCTCQECGYPHDECVCEDNELIQGLLDLRAAANAAEE